MHTFNDFSEWRYAITVRCGLDLTAAYCRERLLALADSSVPSTQSFRETYGEEYLSQVITWFGQAEDEAIQHTR